MRGFVFMVASVFLCACAMHGGERTRYVLTPPTAMSEEQAASLAGQCRTQTADVGAERVDAPVNYSAGATGIAASLFVAGLTQGMADSRANRSALEICLKQGGYVPVMLTEAEWDQMRALPQDEQRSYLTAFIEAANGTR